MCGNDRPVGLTGRNQGSALPIPKYRTANIPGQDWVFRGPGQVFQFTCNVSTFTRRRKKDKGQFKIRSRWVTWPDRPRRRRRISKVKTIMLPGKLSRVPSHTCTPSRVGFNPAGLVITGCSQIKGHFLFKITFFFFKALFISLLHHQTETTVLPHLRHNNPTLPPDSC